MLTVHTDDGYDHVYEDKEIQVWDIDDGVVYLGLKEGSTMHYSLSHVVWIKVVDDEVYEDDE